MSVEKVVEEVCKYPARHVVLTGGEPMVAKGIDALAFDLSSYGKHITIETAATISPRGIACDLASLSPKLSNSIPIHSVSIELIKQHDNRRLDTDIIREWISRYEYQIKFVVVSESDLEEIEDLLASVGGVHPEKVLLMPEGIDRASIDERSRDIVKICQKRGFRYCDRLHIRLFGNTRGT